MANQKQQAQDLDDWIAIEPDGTITAFSGKVELGTGVRAGRASLLPEARVYGAIHTGARPSPADLPARGLRAHTRNVGPRIAPDGGKRTRIWDIASG